MNLTIGIPGIELCLECGEADCQPQGNDYADGAASWQNECQVEGAYGDDHS
jgi:hypothetical protein